MGGWVRYLQAVGSVAEDDESLKEGLGGWVGGWVGYLEAVGSMA